MNNYSEKNYQEFFKEDVYGGFVDYLINKYGTANVITILNNDQLMSKRGIHPVYRQDFVKFMDANPLINRVFLENNMKFISLRNIVDGDLAFPIDTKDDMLMIKEKIRIPEVIPIVKTVAKVTKGMKESAGPMRGQILGANPHERKYLLPKRLTVHFKESYARKFGKTTVTFMVGCRSDAMSILLDRYDKAVAYATIQGEEEFCFVKPRNGKIKRNHKLRG